MTEELKQAKKRLETTFEERLKRRLKFEDGNYWYSSYKIVTEQLVESVNNAARYKDDMSFIKRWVQRVHDKETTLEEFYGVLRYYEPLKPVIKED